MRPRTPSQPTTAVATRAPLPLAIHGIVTSTTPRYKNITSKNIANSSIPMIWVMYRGFFVRTAFISACTHAKLAITRARTMTYRIGIVKRESSEPERSFTRVVIRGSSVYVKTAASSAHQRSRITNASHGTPGLK